ncbi:MAG: AAA family ATPase [Chitinophagales bacterium]|jgi:AAA15 family ATPase/GTPase|nr:AAA family ATPase [Chitinophagales bacterium]
MIKSISINNFRCYGNTTIEGFKRINLIGGLNNSGKTILLEALLLSCSPTTASISLLKQLRDNDSDIKELPEYAWSSFFLNQIIDKRIEINTIYDDGKSIAIVMECNEKTDEFEQLDEKDLEETNDIQTIFNDFVIDERVLKSVLHIKYKNRIDAKEIPILTLMAHKKGTTAKELNVPFTFATYIPASMKRKSAILAREYGIAERKGKEKQVLEALQIIDNNIETIRVSVIGGVHLEVKKKNGSFMPISLYGDAINRILNMILSLINNGKKTVLLIDEIENGIHYKNHQSFWRFLFQLASKEHFDVQIFATTHSIEMMEAFVKTSFEFPDECAYIELYYRELTNEIDYNIHNMSTLAFELSNKMAVRGEQ